MGKIRKTNDEPNQLEFLNPNADLTNWTYDIALLTMLAFRTGN